jgi:L-cysteine desulfidase
LVPLDKQRSRGWMAQDLGSDIVIRTSAASDARMGGATLPAMSNPVRVIRGSPQPCRLLLWLNVQADDERLARALMLSHLSAIYIHYQLPRLSRCAQQRRRWARGRNGVADGRKLPDIAMAIGSMIGDVSGMICDGASNSCAMKVSTSVSSAWKAVMMALDDSA